MTELAEKHRPAGSTRQGHIVLCGLDGLGLRTLQELRKLGEEVTVIVRDAGPGFSAKAVAVGATIVEGNYRDESILRKACVTTARALVLTEDDDVGNLHAALAAQELHPDLRIVVRIFNQDFGQRLESLFQDCAVLSSSAISAPAFVSAALNIAAQQEITVGGTVLYVAEANMSDPDVLFPLARMLPGHAVELFPESGERALCLTKRAAGQSGVDAARVRNGRRNSTARLSGASAYGKALARTADSRLGYALIFLFALILVGTGVLIIFDGLEVLDSLYNVVAVIVGGTFSNPEVLAPSPLLKLFGIALMILGATTLTIFYALITDAIVSVRLERALGRMPVQMRDHFVVCGLGNIGYRIVTQLHQMGYQVAATEKDETGRRIPEIRRAGVPVMIADARTPETLSALNVAKASCLVIATDDDAANLETALNARAIKPDLRIVLRLFDPDLASRVENAFRIHISRSVSALSAPTFAAAAVGRRVIATIPAGQRVLIVAHTTVEPECSVKGKTVGDLLSKAEARVILHTSGGKQTWCPPLATPLGAGDELVFVATRKGLIATLDDTGHS